ncbi:helix-turn-helix domain-containing protein [Curtobacterium sp. MCSS17_007]|uniref:helix-turn-helix domain-containing protein n=1 Tax=Curtobacterium sp. MCSS17_007 TaxID=2175646 RepID=UPI0011B4271A|nr:helix-turn-helix domain-containing protein [Curtobacterium sp. MCSS17_007]WIE76947.1 helix-turn-helix domain-containing protein [Curtobacterium sp. MCSS17_007]
MTLEAPRSGRSTFRRFRVEESSADHGDELDAAYGTSGGVAGGVERFRYLGAGDAEVSVRRAEVQGTRSGVMQPRAEHVVFWTGDGTATMQDLEDGATVVVEPGVPTFVSASRRYGFTADVRTITLLHLSDGVVRRALLRRDHLPVGPVVLAMQPGDEPARAALRRVIRSHGPRLMDVTLDDAARQAVNADVADAVVAAFPVVRHETRPERGSAARAAEWIRANADQPVTLRDIADAVGISERGLQNAMHRRFAESPMARLRAERLEGARRDLEAPEADDTVAEVARRWQWSHLGRFAAAYADRFGEQPSGTLRRGRHGVPRR